MVKRVAVCFNGPKGVGKTTLADMLMYAKAQVGLMLPAQPIAMEVRKGAATHFEDQRFIEEWTREWKDKPCEFADIMSPRQALLHYSRKMKDMYGETVFISRYLEQLKEFNNIIIPDLGDEVELDAITDAFDYVVVVRLNHPDHTFTDEGRHYVKHSGATNLRIFDHFITKGLIQMDFDRMTTRIDHELELLHH